MIRETLTFALSRHRATESPLFWSKRRNFRPAGDDPTNELNLWTAVRAHMGLAELFLAVLVVGVSGINATLPVSAWRRGHDARFLFLAAANITLAALGAIWTWGALPVGPPSYAIPQLPVLVLALVVALFFLVATLWPRRA